jgi:pSer/pThr/pTyr-binding forkhead associated (FHA) protein
MATDAPPPAAPPDTVRTRQLFMDPNHAAREAVVSTDAAAGHGSELPSLVVISGRHQGRRIPVPSTGIVLGREGRLAPFFRDDPLVSRGHAQVYVADDRSVQVADLNSTNGTFVNGEAISSLTRLAGKDVLRIGSIGMRLDQSGAGVQPADETVRLRDVRASWPDPSAGRRVLSERHQRGEGRPGFASAAAWPDVQAEAGYGPADAGPGVIGSSSGVSPGAGSAGGVAFNVDSQRRDPACAKEVGSAMAAGDEHEAGMASGELLDRVRSKRAEVDKYLEFNSRRRCLLVNLVIISGALAALLTAPPAVGGKSFAAWLQQLFHSSEPAWRFLCLFACLASLVSVIAIQIQKSNNYEEHIVRAQGLRAALEVLEASITCGSLAIHEATSQFLKCLEDSSFMEPAR